MREFSAKARVFLARAVAFSAWELLSSARVAALESCDDLSSR